MRSFRTLKSMGLFGALGMFLMASCGESGGDGGSATPEPDAGTGGSSGAGGDGSAGTAGDDGSAGSSGSSGSGGSAGSAGAPQSGWDPSFALPGINGATTSTVFSVVITPARKVWVGGAFSQAGDLPAQNVALWNGTKWAAAGAGLSEPVVQLAPTPDEKIYALTQNLNSGDDGLHFWDGKAWSSVAATTDGSISAIDVGPDGTLYATGYFTTIDGVAVDNVAKRTASGWESLGTTGFTEGFETIKVSPTGRVCVGGLEGSVGCKDASSWSSETRNMEFGMVRTLAFAADGTLYAGGDFMLSGVDSGGGLARLDGASWTLIGGGLLGDVGQPQVHAIAIDGEKVYAAGFFAFAGGVFVRHVAMWNGKKWNDLNGGLLKLMGIDFIEQPRGRTLAVDDGGEIYVGGRLTFAGAENAMRIARWDGSDWHGVDDPTATRLGINGQFANAIYAASDGSIYVGGMFEHMGGNVVVKDVARFDPAKGQWYALGAGLSDVLGFAEKDGEVYAAGGFVSSGNATIKGVARWDGATWQSVGGGLEGYARTIVRGPDNKLYVGGTFTQAGGSDANNVAVWDGTEWKNLGSGVGTETESVHALGFDSTGKLYAGGMFSTAGGQPAKNIAVWDGTSWLPLGDGVHGEPGNDFTSVDSIIVYQDKLVVGGTFTHSGAELVHHVAAWDPAQSQWQNLGSGLSSPALTSVYVQDMATHGSDLYVVGLIQQAGSVPVSHVARFDGTTWHDLDGGLDDVVEGVTVTENSIWFGGTFTRAGELGSIGIARYWLSP